MRTTTAIAVAITALALTGCSTSGATSPIAAPPVVAAPKDAKTVGDGLAQSVKSMKVTRVYTAADDPNHMLGRPNGYISKIAFTDDRVPASALDFQPADAVARGGSVEVYPDADGAKKRSEYLQGIGKATPLFGEYDYTSGSVLVRVSTVLTPDQAKEYEAATKKVTG